MNTIKVALFGAGRMGRIHLSNLLTMRGVELIYVYDPSLYRQRDVVRDERLTPLLVSDAEHILKDPSIDVCVIATPSSLHVDLIEACARADKHVFCEKPVSFDVDSLQKLKQVLKETEIQFQAGFNRRFDPGLSKIERDVSSKLIGPIHTIKIVNRDPLRPRFEFAKNSGGLFFDFAIHDFDMIHFISKEPIVEVYAVGDALIEPKLKDLGDVDTAIISVKMSSGALGVIDCSRETGYGYDQRLEVFGTKGMMRLNNIKETEVVVERQDGAFTDNIENDFIQRYRESYRNQLQVFFDGISNKANPSPGIDDVLSAVRVAQAALLSIKENRSVAV